jgi:hypothetical protein
VVEAVENVATSRIDVPDRTRHRPVTRRNGDGKVTGDFFLTRTRPVPTRTRDPSRVAIPVSITKMVNWAGLGVSQLVDVEPGD